MEGSQEGEEDHKTGSITRLGAEAGLGLLLAETGLGCLLLVGTMSRHYQGCWGAGKSSEAANSCVGYSLLPDNIDIQHWSRVLGTLEGLEGLEGLRVWNPQSCGVNSKSGSRRLVEGQWDGGGRPGQGGAAQERTGISGLC